MSRTGGRFEAKTTFTDGYYNFGAQDFESYGGVATTFVRSGSGLYVQNVAASLSPIFICTLSSILFKTGQTPFLQQQFGTAAGVAGPTSVANTNDPDSQIGPPPQTGAKSITPQAGFLLKGTNISDITLKYSISGAALTAHTIGITKTVFANNVAPVVTNVLANAANGLATATQAQPYVTKIAVNSGMLVTDLSDYNIELDVSTQVAGVYQLFGVTIHVQYNYN